jgi:hypothetical protein
MFINTRHNVVPVTTSPFCGAVCALVVFLVCGASSPASALTLELSGLVKLRPQDTDQALSAARKTILLDDDSLRTTAIVRFSAMAERNSFSNSVLLVLQRRDGAASAWKDIYTFHRYTVAPVVPAKPTVGPVAPTKPPVAGTVPRVPEPSATVPPAPVPQDPTRRPRLKTGPPFDPPSTTVPSVSFDSPSLTLPVGTGAIRASARRADGTSVESPPLPLEVRRAPAVLTLLAMGGTCTDADANTTHQTLTDAGITRDSNVCAGKGVQATYLADLTPMSSVNCNDPCNTGCMNFLEHPALRIMNDRNLANELDSINNPGTKLCAHRVNQAGIRNRIIFGKWRNTEEELVCSTPIKFNAIIDNFVNQGGKSLILIGQSQGGAKLAGMVRDHWRWGNDLTLELIVLWDATSFDVVSFSGHVGIASMGVRRVGSRPKKVLSFFQYSNPVPFQNGAPMLDPAEQHDLDACFSHNGIARSQFVHHRTTEAVKGELQAARDRARL